MSPMTNVKTGAAPTPGLGAGRQAAAPPAWASGLAALVCGSVFGLGLAVAQMVDPRKVLAFLDLAGAWDASLLFVLGAAVAVAALGFAGLRRQGRPLLAPAFHGPTATRVDVRLLLGSALFGMGWGIGGYCPGPAIASIGLANAEAWWFLPAMALGAGLGRWQLSRSAA